MYSINDTIYALATIKGKAGVAVVRVSGNKSREICELICHKRDLAPRVMTNSFLYDKNSEIIDNSLVVFFVGPKSFTGEDVLEFHIHSSLAVIKKLCRLLGEIEGVRLADHGEFSRRAVVNGKMDLTAAEGLLDLINSETEFQRKIALKQYNGEQKKQYEIWHKEITKALAYMEAYLDFPEEEIPESITGSIQNMIEKLYSDINSMLSNSRVNGEAIRTGYKIAIIGKPNSGKSSLLNAITKRDVAIVSEIEGTTRDVIEAYTDIDGYPVTFLDTAGIRDSNDVIEKEGVKRAIRAADDADLILLLTPSIDTDTEKYINIEDESKIIRVTTKADLCEKGDGIKTSTKMKGGIDNLLVKISEKIASDLSPLNDTLLTHERHRQFLKICCDNLLRAQNNLILPLKAEDLRLAARALSEITGAITTDDLLDVIFGDFCIGK